ncbi:hypothetical protein [Streptomyces sp. NBC_01601]|uniref:hypothetical protein n=1 Tax=Streptomyces sp. NBC_01601 TaxID=2975892 RepID=UPI002E28BA36|nr:hypothetical protein [Streptomyces sp. NBC_01601]
MYQRHSRERLTVEGIFPSEYYGDRPQPITVGLHRPPAPMAKDIIRRVLREYLAKIGVALEAAREAERDRRGRDAMNRRLARVLPNISIGATPLHEAPARKTSHWSGGLDSLSPCPAIAPGEVSLSHDGRAMTIKLSDVPAELGLKILSLLDPRDALEGTIAPRAVGREQPELAPVRRIVPGEVVAAPSDGSCGSAAGIEGRGGASAAHPPKMTRITCPTVL